MLRLPLVPTALVVLALAAPAFPQSARATGTVKETTGRAIKGATVRAVNREASPPEIASTTDDRGRWAMIGLRSGQWTLIAEAPGFLPVQVQQQVRVAAGPPLNFVLARDPGPLPATLDRAILQQVTAANGLRDRGEFDQALAAYEQIRTQNPMLTSIDLVVAGVYRQQAAGDGDPEARRALLERAIATYNRLLDDSAVGLRAQAELEATRAEVLTLAR